MGLIFAENKLHGRVYKRRDENTPSSQNGNLGKMYK